MDLEDFYEQINFYINQKQGGWYSPPELDLMVDRAQMTLYNRYYMQFATSQRLSDVIGIFKFDMSFTTTSNGIVNMPANYLNLLSVYTLVTYDDSVTRQRAVEMISENELSIRLNSQVCPVTVYDPIGIQLSDNDVQLYPKQIHNGVCTYLRRPRAPLFSYSLVSGRVIVYDVNTSQQLEWNDKDYKSIALIVLEELGINLSEADLIQWGAAKNQQNLNSNMVE